MEQIRSDKFSPEEVVGLLRSLVSVKSHYFHEDDIMEFVNGWLTDNGLPARIHEYYEEKETHFNGKNVIGEIDGGRPGPVIYLNCHLDTVNLCEGWTLPPYEGVVRDGYMYGVGALDMKAGCCCTMLALAAFYREFGDSFRGRIIYNFVSDEEGPYGLGTTAIILDNISNIAGGMQTSGVRGAYQNGGADFAIITEPSAGFTGGAHPCLALGAKGGYNYRIRLRGRSAHAATPELGINALTEAGKIMTEIENMAVVTDKKLGSSTPCVINLIMNANACSVPDDVAVEVFHHTVRGETPEKIRASIEKAVRKAGIRCSYEISFRQSPAEGFDGGFMPYCTDENDPYVQTLSQAIAEVCGRKPSYTYFQSIGDFNHIGGKLGIPTVLFGPDGDNFHSYDERVRIKSVCEIAESIFEFLKKTNKM